MCYNNKILVADLILILLSQILAERQNKFQPRIINGYTCDTTKIPYFVMILTRTGCGGSLLTYNWVLTAAHCLLPQFVEGVTPTVHSGFDMSPQLKQVRNVKEVYSHPNFVGEDFWNLTDLRYDIGLILVDEPFHRTAATHVATLPAPDFTKKCSQVMAAGIGLTYMGEVVSVKVMVKRSVLCVNLSIIDTNACKEDYIFNNEKIRFDDTIICTHEQRKGTCMGDSGGPLICDNVVIGIVSYGPGECDKRPFAAAYTKVESYLDFIDRIVKFSRINIKDARMNDASVGGKKASDKSHANTVQAHVVVNWISILFSLFINWFVLLH